MITVYNLHTEADEKNKERMIGVDLKSCAGKIEKPDVQGECLRN